MEVTVEELGKLKRKLTVEVPLSDVSAAYEDVYSRIRGNLRIDGFRPGKYPRALAEKRFKELMGQEALQHLVPKYLEQVLQEKKLRPATQPRFDSLDIDKKRPLKFNVEFEIVPEFELVDVKTLALETKQVELAPDAVDKRIEEMRAQRSTPEDKGGPAGKGDIVTFDFEGKRDGEAFPGGTAQNQKAELGEGRYLEAFENELTGMSAGQEKEFPFTFPEDYAQAELAGKTAAFKVTVHKVEGKKLPELDEAFCKQAGVENMDALRKQVQERLKAEREQEIEREYHESLAGQLRERYAFEVPETLVQSAVADFEQHQLESHPDMRGDPAQLEEAKAEEAKRQATDLRLNYVLQRYANEFNIQVNPEEIRTRFMLQAYIMRQNPEELIRTQYGDVLLRQIQEQLLTNKTLTRIADLVLGREPKIEAKPGAGALPTAGTEHDAAQDHEHDHPPHDHDHDHAHGHAHDHAHDHAHGHAHDHD